MRFQFMNLERPGSDIGLRPPADFEPCYAGRAEGLDTTGDGNPDVIRVRDASGRDTCHGTDTNHDGKIDTWDVIGHDGQIAKRAHDSNGDGKADHAWTFDPNRPGCAMVHPDHNGDGKPDPGAPIDMCRQLAPPATPTPAAPDGGA